MKCKDIGWCNSDCLYDSGHWLPLDACGCGDEHYGPT